MYGNMYYLPRAETEDMVLAGYIRIVQRGPDGTFAPRYVRISLGNDSADATIADVAAGAGFFNYDDADVARYADAADDDTEIPPPPAASTSTPLLPLALITTAEISPTPAYHTPSEVLSFGDGSPGRLGNSRSPSPAPPPYDDDGFGAPIDTGRSRYLPPLTGDQLELVAIARARRETLAAVERMSPRDPTGEQLAIQATERAESATHEVTKRMRERADRRAGYPAERPLSPSHGRAMGRGRGVLIAPSSTITVPPTKLSAQIHNERRRLLDQRSRFEAWAARQQTDEHQDRARHRANRSDDYRSDDHRSAERCEARRREDRRSDHRSDDYRSDHRSDDYRSDDHRHSDNRSARRDTRR